MLSGSVILCPTLVPGLLGWAYPKQLTPLPASDSGSAAVWGSKRINPWPQSCLCLTWSGYPSNNDDQIQTKFKFPKQ